MENKDIDKITFSEKIENFLKGNKKKIITGLIILIIGALCYLGLIYLDNKKNKDISEKYIKAGIYLTSKDLDNSKLGIIGPGKIGREVAKIAKSLNMQVMYYGKKTKKNFPGNFINLENLLKNADFISIHLSLIKETTKFLNMDHFTMMKNDAVLINTSRGQIINQSDLENALKKKIIGGAALDVTDPEPLPATSELLKMQNVFISPHLGSATKKTRLAMASLAIKNLIELNAGRKPPNMVNE